MGFCIINGRPERGTCEFMFVMFNKLYALICLFKSFFVNLNNDSLVFVASLSAVHQLNFLNLNLIIIYVYARVRRFHWIECGSRLLAFRTMPVIHPFRLFYRTVQVSTIEEAKGTVPHLWKPQVLGTGEWCSCYAKKVPTSMPNHWQVRTWTTDSDYNNTFSYTIEIAKALALGYYVQLQKFPGYQVSNFSSLE